MELTASRRARASAPASEAPDLAVAVIGAGPHGLSAATHLRRAGVEAHVLGPPMSFWQSMPEGMKLRSNRSATNMIERSGPFSIDSYHAATGNDLPYPAPLSEFIAYGSWVQEHAVPDVDRRMVTLLRRTAGRFLLELDDGSRLTARRVVIACGISRFEYVPPGFGHLPSASVSHSAHHRDLRAFAGRRVAVVGGGQSAFECAALMHERGAEQVEVLVKARRIVWLRGNSVYKRIGPLAPVVYAPTDVGPLWYSRLVTNPDRFRHVPRPAFDRIARRCVRPACSHFVRVRLGGVRISTGVQIVSANAADDEVRLSLSDGRVLTVDHVMFATGYRVDMARYGFLSDEILSELRVADGYPLLRRGMESSIPGLHVVGAPATRSFGPTMRFVSGSWYSGQAVAREIACATPARRLGS